MSIDVVSDLERRVRQAVSALEVDPDLVAPAVRRSEFADFQADLAMGLAKQLGRPPREVAEALVEAGTLADVCAAVEVAGPGFLNLTLNDNYLSQQLLYAAEDQRLGVTQDAPGRRVVVDYSAPNVAKEMHVGHLRSTVIGDAIVRLLEFLGHEVIRQNHVGDWGTPFGMLIEHFVDIGEREAVHELSVGDLNGFYQQARREFEETSGFAHRARQRVVALQAGDPETLRLWQLLVDASTEYFSSVYEQLGVRLTEKDLAPESSYNEQLDAVVADLSELGLVSDSEGAWCVFPEGFVRRDGKPLPLIVRKGDGGYGYAATDLAAIRHRIDQLGADWLIYVVGAPQAQHLSMVFFTARAAGWLPDAARVDHVGFGSVLGADGKMFKTRAGRSVRLTDLLDEAVDRAQALIDEKDPDLSDDERKQLARIVGIGAIKYADLSVDRIKDYTFDWDRMLSLTGNTSPYLQYAHARIQSILRRADSRPTPERVQIEQPAERALALSLLTFNRVLSETADSLAPHRLCTYLYDLAAAYTDFYETCPVLKAPTTDLVSSRLLLCELTGRTLARGLDLLGIEAPDRM